MDPNSASVITEVIDKLQGLLGGKSSSSGTKSVSIPFFDQALKECVQKANTLEPQIKKLTSIYEQASTKMKVIMGYSKSCKKYSASQEQKLKKLFTDLSKEIDVIEKKGFDWIDHCRAVRELLSTTFWVFVNTPEFILKGGIEASDFNAIKFQKKKNSDHNDWWKLMGIAARKLQSYVKDEYQMGLTFNFHGSDLWDELLSGSSSSVPTHQEPAKHHTPQHSSHPPASVKKAPKKQMVGPNYFISNYEGGTIQMNDKEVQMKNGIFFENSNNTNLKINAKSNSIQLNKCENVTIEVISCVSGISVMNSSHVTVIVKNSCPSLTVDKSKTIKAIINEKNIPTFEIVSSLTTEISISSLNDKNQQGKEHYVPEQTVTKWKNGKFQTSIYDKFI